MSHLVTFEIEESTRKKGKIKKNKWQIETAKSNGMILGIENRPLMSPHKVTVDRV